VVTARATEIAYVDMRYANGFAVGWRSGRGEVKRG
jgi:cell division septal protein FtsQ